MNKQEMKTYVCTKMYTQMFIAAFFIIAESGNKPNVQQLISV